MINEAKEELESTLRHNDEIREEERVRMEQNVIIIFSDEESDSRRRKIQTSNVV